MILIRFIADHSIVSRAIRWRTDGPVSHVEFLRVDVDGCPLAVVGARLKGGVTSRRYDPSPLFEEWYSAPGIDEAFSNAEEYIGRKYDWRDIVYDAVGWYPASFDPHQFICSCFVAYSNRLAWAAGKSPAWISPEVPTREITPMLLYASGSLKMYRKIK